MVGNTSNSCSKGSKVTIRIGPRRGLVSALFVLLYKHKALRVMCFKHCAAAQDQWAPERPFRCQNEEISAKMANIESLAHWRISENVIRMEADLGLADTVHHKFFRSPSFQNLKLFTFYSLGTKDQPKRFGFIPSLQAI